MNVQLNQLLAPRRIAELLRAGVPIRGRKSRRRNLITRLIAPVMLAALALSGATATADPLGQINEFSTGLPAGSAPEWIAAGPDGNLWFTDLHYAKDGEARQIGRITPSGQITEFSTGLNPGAYPVAITAGPDGNLWFIDQGATPAIGRISPSGQITEFATGLNPGAFPAGITAGPDGDLWFTDEGATRAIGRISPSGQIAEFATGLNPGAFPAEITAGPDGNLWFTDNAPNAAIGRITPSGHITEFTDPENPYSLYPIGIAAGPDGNLWFADQSAEAIGRITPSGQFTEFKNPQNPDLDPEQITTGPDGNLWFTDTGNSAIGRITPSGQITEFSTSAFPMGITVGPDGDLWFADQDGAIGRVGSGAPSALAAPPSVSGAGVNGSAEACQSQWSSWAGYAPSPGLYPFDGYAWLRDGTPVAGQSARTYVPTAGDVGHRLSCRLTVTYPLPFSVTATATSPAITVQAAPPPPPTPALSALHITPRMFTLTGRRVGGRCLPLNRSDRGERSCIRPVALRVRFTLSVGATVTFAIERALPGRLSRGRCSTLTRSDRRHRPCTRPVLLRGTTVINAGAGADSFTFKGRIDGRALVPGSYRLLATPITEGIAGQRQQTTFEITR
jgi:streptogramin lyase